jgi:hypothetical protein
MEEPRNVDFGLYACSAFVLRHSAPSLVSRQTEKFQLPRATKKAKYGKQ